ncbi:MAG TPA: metal ABC transporter ATP-binding protein [Actinomycetota bacterium]
MRPGFGSDQGAAPLLAATGVSFAYGRSAVLEDVSLQVRPGEFVALVGPNGSGKSTLLRVLLGSLPAQRGSVRLFGDAPAALREPWRLGYVPQRPTLASEVPATVEEIVATGRLARRGWWRPPSRQDREAVRHAIGSVGLGELALRPINQLSGGQQQRAFIARAFASEPDLLVLDEPIAGVDAGSQALFRDSLAHLMADHGAGVLLVSHELSAVAQDLDRVIVLKRRVLFDGPPSELMAGGVSLGVHSQDLPLWLEGLT